MGLRHAHERHGAGDGAADLTHSPPRRRLGKAGWNERLKLFANTLNALGLAVMALGVLGPIFSAAAGPSGVQFVLCAAIFGSLHFVAHLVLRWLED